MAVHPSNSRGSDRKPKKPNTRPYDRGRVTALEAKVIEIEAPLNGS